MLPSYILLPQTRKLTSSVALLYICIRSASLPRLLINSLTHSHSLVPILRFLHSSFPSHRLCLRGQLLFSLFQLEVFQKLTRKIVWQRYRCSFVELDARFHVRDFSAIFDEVDYI